MSCDTWCSTSSTIGGSNLLTGSTSTASHRHMVLGVNGFVRPDIADRVYYASKKSEETKMKEIKNQKVVDLYFQKKLNYLGEERDKKYNAIKEEDKHYQFIVSIQKQIDDYVKENEDLKNEKRTIRDFSMTKESEEKVEQLNATYRENKKELENKKEEILALLSGCDRYEQEMMILNAYGIVSYDDRERIVKMTD